MADGYVFFGAGSRDDFSLVPPDTPADTDVPFIDLILVTLGYGPTYGLSAEAAVREYVGGQPGMYEQVRALGAQVYLAGTRARDSGQLRNSFDDHLRYYAPDEIWGFDLAADVIAMLAVLLGVSGGAHFRSVQALRDIDGSARTHTWHKQVKHAGDGPADFSELRARVPRHKPHPARFAGGGDSGMWM